MSRKLSNKNMRPASPDRNTDPVFDDTPDKADCQDQRIPSTLEPPNFPTVSCSGYLMGPPHHDNRNND